MCIRDRSYYNPANQDEKTKVKNHASHFRFGSAAHAKILEPQAWIKNYIVRPIKWKSWRSEDAKHWRWVQEYQKGLTVVTPEEVDRVDAMAERIHNDPVTSILFSNGVPEVSMFLELPSGVVIKVRPDIMSLRQDLKTLKWGVADGVFTDYKTTYDNSIGNCMREIAKWGYDQKLANAAFVACKLFGIRFGDLDFVLSFQKSEKPFGITNIELDNEYMFKLVAKNLFAAERFAQGILPMGEGWKGYSEEIVPYRGSSYYNDKLDLFIQDGTYPNIDPKTMNIVKD